MAVYPTAVLPAPVVQAVRAEEPIATVPSAPVEIVAPEPLPIRTWSDDVVTESPAPLPTATFLCPSVMLNQESAIKVDVELKKAM